MIALPLQSLLFFDYYYNIMVSVITFLLALFKLVALPYPQGYWTFELMFLALGLVLSLLRIDQGGRGNRIESNKYIGTMVLLTFFTVGCNAYFMLAQTYIFKIELYLQGIASGFAALEAIIGAVAFCEYLQGS